MISIAMLGPVEVRRDGELVVVPSGKPTELLLHLALAAGTMVHKERLLEDLWADDAVRTSANTVQSKVSRLRKALGEPGVIIGSPMGYTLAVDPSAVDALELARLAEQVTVLHTAGDLAGVVDASTSALSLFRGETTFGAHDADWLRPHRVRIDGLRLRLIEDRLRARVGLGATAEVVGELDALVAAHPLREGLWALLITALYRAGRQADALAAYRTVREHLVEELGIDPGPDLQRLEQQVLAHDPALDGPVGRPPPPAPAPTAAAARDGGGNLPPLSSSLVGREDACADVAALLEAHRLVTLVGPAGVGKTRLAIECARRAESVDGAWIVRLETARSAEAVADTVAVALHATDAGEAALVERLRGADSLIVLDNCEHVVDTIAELVGPLLRAGPGVRVLATSQLPLGVDGEDVYAVDPLPFTDAVALFAQRAEEQGQSFVDPDVAAAMEDVCRSLDGLPLAIELAAARTRSLSLAEISRRLTDRFALLSDPTGRRPARQRTLSAAIAWSYDLLFPDDQRGLWALATFVGGAPLEGVETVLGVLGVPDQAAIDVVGRLVDRSLVSVEHTDDGAVRYWLLDSVRSYALAQLDNGGEASVAFGAHAAWIAHRTDSHDPHGHEQTLLVAFARTERANIEAALEWTAANDPILGLTIASRLGWSWVVAGDAVGAQRLQVALDAAGEAASPALRADGLLPLGWLHAAAGNVEVGRAAVDEALALLARVDDDHARARADFFLAYVLSQKGEFDESLQRLAGAQSVFSELGRAWEEIGTWVLTAHVTLARGDRAAADQACTEATRLLDIVNDPWYRVHVEAMLGAIAQAEHRYADACAHLDRAAASSRSQGFAAAEAYHRANLGRAQQQRGDLDAAASTLRDAIDIARATGDLRMAALARLRLGRVLREGGDLDAARSSVLAAQRWYRDSGGGDHARLADCLAAAMDPSTTADAAAVLEAVLEDARGSGDPEVEVLALDALALRAARSGDIDRAKALLEESEASMSAGHLRVTDADRVDARAARELLG